VIDLIKIAIYLTAFFWGGPVLGAWAARARKNQRMLLCAMLVLTTLPAGKFTLMVCSVETYRGHTKGFECNFLEIIAFALVLASSAQRYDGWKKWGPGSRIYLLWSFLAALSLISSVHYSLLYGCMGVWKFSMAILTMLGAYHAMKDEEDLRWILRTMAGIMLWNGFCGLKDRFLGGVWQYKGSFEHQNSMAMWAYIMGLPLLGVALSRKTSDRDARLYLGGFACAVLCIILAVSRASLGAVAGGTVAIFGIAWLRKPSARVVGLTALAIIGAMFISAFALNSLRARLDAVKDNSERNEFDLRDILNFQSRAMLASSSFGVGWNCFGVANSRPYGASVSAILEDWDASRGYTIYDENYWGNPLTESLYWLFLAETGYPGFVGFVLFEICTLVFAIRCAWTYRGTLSGAFASALAVTFTICYLHGTVERILTQTKNLAQWMILCGILAALEHHRRLLRQRRLEVAPSANRSATVAA